MDPISFAIGFTVAILLAGLWNMIMSGSLEKRLANISTWARNLTDKMALDDLHKIITKEDITVEDMAKIEDLIKSAREDKEGVPHGR